MKHQLTDDSVVTGDPPGYLCAKMDSRSTGSIAGISSVSTKASAKELRGTATQLPLSEAILCTTDNYSENDSRQYLAFVIEGSLVIFCFFVCTPTPNVHGCVHACVHACVCAHTHMDTCVVFLSPCPSYYRDGISN